MLTPPIVSSPPVPNGDAGERWLLMSTYIGHSGPAACIQPFDGMAREPIAGTLVIHRSGESIQFVTEHNRYSGTISGDQFSAAENDDAGATWECGGERLRFRTEGSVSGRFSNDGRALTGEEVAVFRLESGATIRRQWNWSASRQ
jgi:hypothetical protein